MAGHSKWHNIKHKKSRADAARWKIFTIHAKLIAMAAQKWGDPDLNPTLSEAIAKAKADNVPNDNIERAIKKWTGQDKSAESISEIVYEGYAPGWVAIIVKTLTDNKNRTASNIRHIFTKMWWNLWETGAVSWMFDRKWVIIISMEKYSAEALEELVFETTAEDFAEEEGIFRIYTSVSDFAIVRDFFASKDIEFEHADVEYIANNESEITEFDKALKFTKMLELFDEDDDVESVINNAVISPELQNEVDEFIEKNKFRT